MKKDCISSALSLCLSKIGYYIGCHPQWYIASFFFISIVLGTGLLKFSMVNDIEYLYSPKNAKSRLERTSVKSMFPSTMNTDMDLIKDVDFPRGGLVIAESNYEGYIKSNAPINDLVNLDRIIQNISIFWNNSFLSYKDLCKKKENNKCYGNFVSYLKKRLERMKNGKAYIRYPTERISFDVKFHAINLGGVLTNQSGYVEDFKAVRLVYSLDDDSEEKKRMASMWEEKFVQILSNVKFRNIQFYIFTRDGINVESSRNSEIAFSLSFISGTIMTLFAIISCLSSDAITSKPLIGVGGVLSSFLAIITAFGLLLHCKMEYIDMNISAIFLLLGVGLDDSFVLLASWRRTNKEDSVEKRMSDAYSEAAVSVTITSLTNFLTFSLGLMSFFQVIRIFSVYTSLSILFDYIYQIFFFGGIMALDGYREKNNIHSFFLHTIQPIESLETKITRNDDKKNKLKKRTFLLIVTENLGNLLGKRIVKTIVVAVFFCNLIGCIIFMIEIKQGMKFTDIFPFSSYAIKFNKAHYKYFTDYSHYVQVVFNQTLDYSDPCIQYDIENILRNFESAPFAKGSAYTACWLKEYLSYINNPEINYLIKDYNMNNTEGFLDGFKEVFLKYKSGFGFENDIFWNKERNQILASRCLVLYGNVRNGSSEKQLLEGVRRIASESKYDVFIFNFWFILYEQYLNMPIICLQSLSVAVLMIALVFLMVTVDLFTVISLALNVIFILIQSIGYMSLWNVNLDQISVNILIMSAGLCVDYSAHIAYAYKNCQQKEPNEKIKASLYLVGYPVVQGCLSTILGVVPLIFGPSYTFVIFFKIIFLIVLFSAFNGLIVLPVMFSIGDSVFNSCKKKNIERE